MSGCWVRTLIFKTPYSHDLARKTGTTLACQEDAERLLAANQLVAVFPEGFKGLGKPYADRYKLQRFGRGGFVSAALRAQVPIIPTAIVGSEEIYPLIARAPALARVLGVPYFPITPLFPVVGPARHDPSAEQVDHPVRRGHHHRRARSWCSRRPHDRVQHHRPGARDHPADPVRAADAAAERLLLASRNHPPRPGVRNLRERRFRSLCTGCKVCRPLASCADLAWWQRRAAGVRS